MFEECVPGHRSRRFEVRFKALRFAGQQTRNDRRTLVASFNRRDHVALHETMVSLLARATSVVLG